MTTQHPPSAEVEEEGREARGPTKGLKAATHIPLGQVHAIVEHKENQYLFAGGGVRFFTWASFTGIVPQAADALGIDATTDPVVLVNELADLAFVPDARVKTEGPLRLLGVGISLLFKIEIPHELDGITPAGVVWHEVGNPASKFYRETPGGVWIVAQVNP